MKLHIISGFLGAGKTTYIKSIIKELKGKIAIIENEFGDVSIDHLEFEENYYVKNIYAGCICCSLVGELYEGIKEIYETHQPDHIIIEPSGIALLSEVLKVCKKLQNELDFILEEVVTLVDCKNYDDYKENFGSFYMDQIYYGKKIKLTHTTNSRHGIREELMKVKEGIDISKFQVLNSMSEEIETITVYPKTIELEYIKSLNDRILSNAFGKIIRIKGYINTNSSSYKLDYITGKLTIIESKESSSVLVFIGSKLNKIEISNQFQ